MKKKSTKKTLLGIVISLCIILLVVGLFLLQRFVGKTKMNDDFVNGNSGGNLYNAGLFCEYDGTLYFSNPDDNGRLYAMDMNGDNLRKLCNDKVMYINADENYLYYVRNNSVQNASEDYPYFAYNNNSLCRIDHDGQNTKILDRDPCIYASLSGNYLYYLHYDTETATTLYRVCIDGSQKEQVLPYYIFTCCMVGPKFYYNNPNDGSLYSFDTRNHTSTQVLACNCYRPITTDGTSFIYQNVEDNFTLTSQNTISQAPLTLGSDSADVFTVAGDKIFYQKFDEEQPGLYSMNLDGSNVTKIAPGTYSNLHTTSKALYFKEYFTGEFHYVSLSNPTEVKLFHPGKLEDKK